MNGICIYVDLVYLMQNICEEKLNKSWIKWKKIKIFICIIY